MMQVVLWNATVMRAIVVVAEQYRKALAVKQSSKDLSSQCCGTLLR